MFSNVALLTPSVYPAHSYFWQKKLEAEISGSNLGGFYLYTFYQEKIPAFLEFKCED